MFTKYKNHPDVNLWKSIKFKNKLFFQKILDFDFNFTCTYLSFASHYKPDGSEGYPKCIFSLSTHTKQLLIVSLCDATAGIGNCNARMDRRQGQNSYVDGNLT